VQTSRVVAAGRTRSAVARSAPTALRTATLATAMTARSAASDHAERTPSAGAAAGSNPVSDPAVLERRARDDRQGARRAHERDVPAVDEQERAEQEVLHAGPGGEDVRGEDDAEGERPTRTSAVSESARSRARSDRASSATPPATSSAAPPAPSPAAKPRPSASTRPGNVAVPTACA
jgi:hypothetical protein